MAWKDIYTEAFSEREIFIIEIIEKYAIENRGAFPTISEISRISNLNNYHVNEIIDSLIEKEAIVEVPNLINGSKTKKILKGSRLLGKSEGIYKKIPNVFKGKPQIKTALIPYIRKVKNIEYIFSQDNILEYIAVPFQYNREENMFAFNIPKRGMHSSAKSLNIGNIAIVDTKAEYLSEDFVAKLYFKDKIIVLDKYYIYKERTNKEKDEYIILGKVVGAFKAFTNWYLK